MGATLQFLSGGRFILGIGAGWHEEEYRAYGYDFPQAGVRVEQLAETLQICLLYTSDAADDLLCVDLGGRRIIKKQKHNYHRTSRAHT